MSNIWLYGVAVRSNPIERLFAVFSLRIVHSALCIEKRRSRPFKSHRETICSFFITHCALCITHYALCIEKFVDQPSPSFSTAKVLLFAVLTKKRACTNAKCNVHIISVLVFCTVHKCSFGAEMCLLYCHLLQQTKQSCRGDP